MGTSSSKTTTTAITSTIQEQPLSEAEPGRILSIERLEGAKKVCHRLREVGFCEKATIELLSCGRQMICKVCGTRFALNQQLAKNIWVKPQTV